MAIIHTTPGFGDGDRLPGIQPAYQNIVFGAGRKEFSPVMLAKLRPENSTGLGSGTVQGNVVPTQAASRIILNVVNTYLVNKLTADELKIILDHRDKFEFTVGVGDRRSGVKSRFRIATNWHGEDVSKRILTPDPFNDPPYHHTLTFSGTTGQMTMTDDHVGSPSTYGSIRYMTVRYKP
ncbi:hypothetical protein PRB20_000043 [Salmonella enterica]|nr:hypothetical protein [Salmonella enterica]EAW1261833.1 hypothetical protein [Salmonella enterica subsp. diarizonae]EEG1121476.1 hypothetical protein [Salmonella enterica subsp. diarizonae]EGU4505554.1 hypothetical protein [Salmonella enterica]EKK4208755.1 hypothetical protein [Salmonella enterica]